MHTFIIATTAATALFSSGAFAQEPSKDTASIPDFSGAGECTRPQPDSTRGWGLYFFLATSFLTHEADRGSRAATIRRRCATEKDAAVPTADQPDF